ncbi:lipopolysaccharide biosynthesis protein [Bosea sp. F3-2]|uniref:lipopolysaccharide biosynthesis protein n=1 Tax=Bosea sp. F3-2 TaxID=2599640 RepID=UPI001655BFD6|nr:lipopolysaccharide biosynthesis protein [Bosea sp. F3-2]
MIGNRDPRAQTAINERVLSPHHLRDALGKRTIVGGAIAVGAQLVRFALQVAGSAMLARLLEPSQFGLVAMGSTVTAFIIVLTELNVATAAVQQENLDQNTASALMWIAFGMGFLAFLLSAAAAPASLWFFDDRRLPLVVLGLSLNAPIYAVGALHTALLTRNMRWLDLQIASLSGLAISLVVAVIAAKLFAAGYWALVIQSWVTAFTTTAAVWILCPWRPSIVKDWSAAKSSLKFGFHLTGAMILNYFHQQLDNILIGARWGSVELGFYSRAYNLLMMPLNFLSGPLGSAMIPALSRLHREPARWREAYLDALGVITFVGAGMAGMLYGGASPIVDIVLGPQWQPVKLIFSCLVLGMLASVPMSATGWLYISTGRTDRMFYWSLIGVPIYVTSFLIGLPYGAVGVALCYSISRYVAFFPSMFMAIYQTNITIFDILAVIAVPTLTGAAIGFALSLVVAVLSTAPALAAIAAAGLLYAGVCALAVSHLPVYRRLRSRGLHTLNSAYARLLRRGPAG